MPAETAEYPAFFGRFSTQESYRTGFPNVISVGAINSFGSVSSYSNYGWFADLYAPGGSGAYPFADPGNILSTFPNYTCVLGRADSTWYYDGDSLIITSRIPEQKTYGFLAGTSMATPFVTGTVSLMFAANPDLSESDVRKILVKTADNIMTLNGLVAILNPGAAVTEAKSILSSVTNQNPVISNSFVLHQNYPNPFNPSTTISYAIQVSGFVTLKIYDMLGKEVAVLVSEEKSAGKYEVNFNASNLSSGTYVYRLSCGSFIQNKKMILLK